VYVKSVFVHEFLCIYECIYVYLNNFFIVKMFLFVIVNKGLIVVNVRLCFHMFV